VGSYPLFAIIEIRIHACVIHRRTLSDIGVRVLCVQSAGILAHQLLDFSAIFRLAFESALRESRSPYSTLGRARHQGCHRNRLWQDRDGQM
jgi:hypothetical protein